MLCKKPPLLKFLAAATISVSIFAAAAQAQTAPPDLNTLLDAAAAQSKKYVETFKDLLAEETKSFTIFDKRGEPKKRKTIRSNFLVYQLSKDSARVAEYRNVIAVDGKPQADADKRAQDLFERLVKAESSQRELQRLQDESARFDEELSINGLTLFQSIVLADDVRPYFDFRIGKTELRSGIEVVEIIYRQKRQHPMITINAGEDAGTSLRSQNYDIEIDAKGPFNERINGSLLVDPATGMILGEHRERTIQPAGFQVPMVVAVDDFEFRPSDFGIPTPLLISHLQYRVRAKEQLALKDILVTFEYGKFSKPDVEVKSGEVKQ